MDAVRAVTGLETTTEDIPVHGMLDPDILTRMMLNAGASRRIVQQAMPAIIQRAQSLYVRRCPDLRKKVCPGVRAVLARIRRREIPVGLVTGNLTRIGWKKMERAGIRHHFRFGAFAEMARDRAGLLRLAIRQARREGWIAPDAGVTLIGDAPSDVLAAKANGARAIAVSTGISTSDELQACDPDVLLEDLCALRLEMLA